MKHFLLFLTLLCVAGLLLYLNPDYRDRLQSFMPATVIGINTARLYKWRNQRGEWQVTDRLPPPGVDYERLHDHRDANVLPLPAELRKQ